MNNFKKLIGKTVVVDLSNEHLYLDLFMAKVERVVINDYYFEEKNECIYVEVYIRPLQDMPDDFDFEIFNEPVSLDCIRKPTVYQTRSFLLKKAKNKLLNNNLN